MTTKNNTLSNLNDHLFAQMERLSKSKGTDEIKIEIERTRAMSGLAKEMIENAKTALEAHHTLGGKETPAMLQIGE